jgi:Mg/Co/Ni transporter MgtE
VLPGEDEMAVAEMISKYHLHALPVVDEDRYMHGIVTADDIIYILMPPEAKRRRRKV